MSEVKEVEELKELFKTLTIYGDSEIFEVAIWPQIKDNPDAVVGLMRAIAQKTVDGCINKILEAVYRRPSSDRCNKGVKQDTITPKPTSGLTPYDDIYKIILKYQESVNTKLIWELVDYMKAVVSRFSQKKVTKEQIADAVNSHYFYYKGFGIDEGYEVGSHISQKCKDKLIDNIYKSIEGKTK